MTWQRPGENWSSMLMVLRDSEQGISLLQSSLGDTKQWSTEFREEKTHLLSTVLEETSHWWMTQPGWR